MTDDLVERVAQEMRDAAVLWLYENPSLRPENVPYELLARAAIAVVLEEAAKVCISVSTDVLTKVGREHEPYMRATAEDCAAAIRALVKEP